MRSQSRKSPNFKQTNGVHVIKDDGDSDYRPDDGLVACPSCGTRMKEENVFSHLDTCSGENTTSDSSVVKAAATSPPSSTSTRVARAKTPAKPIDRLPKLNYTILKDTALKRKLAELGIPNWGNKALLTRRHSEWVNLWNANCDSSKPRTKRELLHELDSWERSQGGLASSLVGGVNSGSSIMKKDFDGSAWAANHNEDFQRLIAKARPKPRTLAARAEANAGPLSIPQSDGAMERQFHSFDSIEDGSFDVVDGQRYSASTFDSAVAEKQRKSGNMPRSKTAEKSVIDLETEMMEIPAQESIPFEQSREVTDPVPQLRQRRTLAQSALTGRPPDNS
ncbi:dna repair protein [Lasallia pustulata]|uniref:Postreplication repair E3 ubiquitin-protein ligase RAD18 n=1 Tax=Lasallia pustulata TaxID=136370 RepID=A0A1W5CT23_9LECA|nr:dna repair protein [Lasallia pustulata]